MRETRLFGSMSGNRKQSHVKPDCGNASESRAMSHRKANATAPVLDSTFVSFFEVNDCNGDLASTDRTNFSSHNRSCHF